MADNPITVPLPADLPENWTYGQTVAPTGEEVGLSKQHGYNYLTEQANATQRAVKEIGEAFSALYGSGDIVPLKNGGTGAKTPQQALFNLGAEVRPTLLRNGFFIGGGSQKGAGFFPINQRGKLSYADGYTIDGWKLNSGTLTVKDDCIELEAPPENFATFECTVEAPSNYSGKTLTLSALAERISGTEYCYITNIFDEYKKDVAIPDAKGFCSLTDTAGTLTSSLKFVFVCGKGCKIRMYAAKMEEGDFHTLGWMDKSGLPHLFVGPKFGVVLSECQRYLFRIGINSTWGYAGDAETVYLFVPIPVTMRTTPVWSGAITRLYPFDGNSVTGVTVLSLSDGVVCLQVKGTGFTPGKVYSVSEITDGFLSAEL
ncbi:hypothetical protein [Clostridium sp. J1101437_171009_A5]|uniref:hypothetical protein n=1 Tax=Clostridium sp. J1101437_171009_A5 TaxID=2787098 RepID=UPI0025702A32|nr:hypothetical protein [Clostridium sp. J1101437_171009_A5]